MKSNRRSCIRFIVILGLVLVLFSGCSKSENRKELAENASSVAGKYFDSWIDEDPDALSSVLSDDLIGFDASMQVGCNALARAG